MDDPVTEFDFTGRYGEVRCAKMSDGSSPSRDFCQKLRPKDLISFQTLFRCITDDPKLQIPSRELFSQIEGQLWEFKRSGKKKMRIFTFRDRHVWWLVYGISGKKEDEIDPGEVKRAKKYMEDAMRVLRIIK
jgi:hypothetical protein